MAKEKAPSEKPARKPAAKKSAAKTAAPKAAPKPVMQKVESAAVAAAPQKPVEAAPRKPLPSHAELYEEIRRRAYELYVQRGGQHGSHEADWHRAENEIRAKYK